tara:strand:- start:70 stop:450 length:381 start_codon:yes stop_codon:yes gene_type:complete
MNKSKLVKKIIFLLFFLTPLSSCMDMTAQDWQDLSRGLNDINNALYGTNNTSSSYSNNSTNTGFTKVCYYNGPGGQSALTVPSVSICPLTHTPSISGFTKVCTYNTIGGQKALTVPSVSICPLTYN